MKMRIKIVKNKDFPDGLKEMTVDVAPNLNPRSGRGYKYCNVELGPGLYLINDHKLSLTVNSRVYMSIATGEVVLGHAATLPRLSDVDIDKTVMKLIKDKAMETGVVREIRNF